MSVKAHAWAKTVRAGSPTLKAVLVAIADYADQGGRAWPSQERLAEDTEFSVRAVRNAITALEEKGLLKREERRRSDGTRGTDLLTLLLTDNRHEVPVDDEQPAPRSKQPAPHTDQPARGAGLTTFEPSLNHQRNRSDADASGSTESPAEPSSPKDLLWCDGVLTLRALGLTDPESRRFIGKLLRDTGGDAGRIHWAIDETSASGTRDPIPFVTRLLNGAPAARAGTRPRYRPGPTGTAAHLIRLEEKLRLEASHVEGTDHDADQRQHHAPGSRGEDRGVAWQAGSGGRPADALLRAAGFGGHDSGASSLVRRAKAS